MTGEAGMARNASDLARVVEVLEEVEDRVGCGASVRRGASGVRYGLA